jgi:uncharacterized protein YfdQ (DUF2303 family)
MDATLTAQTNTAAAERLLLDTGMLLAKPTKNPAQHGAHYVVIPEGHTVETLPAVELPKWPSGCVKLRDAASFIKYVSDHKRVCSRIYATVDPATFLAVLDDHVVVASHAEPFEQVALWREFRAEFKVPPSREWKTWNAANRQQMNQQAFAEFLQENLPDIIVPDGAALMDMALNFESSQKGHFIASQRLQDGSQNLQWAADNNDAGLVTLPPEITLSIPVFENESPSLQHARLRFRIDTGEGKLKLWYELIRPHKTLENAFRDAWKRIAEETKVPILLGTPE